MASNLLLNESWLANNTEPHVLRWQNLEGQSGVQEEARSFTAPDSKK